MIKDFRQVLDTVDGILIEFKYLKLLQFLFVVLSFWTVWIVLEMSSHQARWQIRVNEFFMWAVSSLCWSVNMATRII